MGQYRKAVFLAVVMLTICFVSPLKAQGDNQTSLAEYGINTAGWDIQGLALDSASWLTLAFVEGMVEGAGGYVGETLAQSVGELAYFTAGLVYDDEQTEIVIEEAEHEE
jgi:hypothetical protein